MILFLSIFKIFINFLFPIGGNRSTFSESTNGFAHNFIVKLGSHAITIIIYCTISTDTISSRSFNSINVSTDKKKLPTIFFFLSFNHLFNLFASVFMTCVLLTIGCNNKHCMLRHIFRTSVLMNVTNMMNSPTNSIDKRCTTTTTSCS